jgi:hypothetical protein
MSSLRVAFVASVPASCTDRQIVAGVVWPTACKVAAGELTRRTGLLSGLWRIVTTADRSSSSMDARLSTRSTTFLSLPDGRRYVAKDPR